MTTRSTSLRQWMRDHDEKWLFVVLYLGLAVGLSVFVSLFWLIMVAGVHFLLECVRQAYHRKGGLDVVTHALWEIKLDVGLVLLALTLVLYIEVVLGILGIQSAARAAAVTRAGARIGSRAAAWERNLRTFLVTVDEMVRIGYAAVMMRRKSRGSNGDAAVAEAEATEAGMVLQNAAGSFGPSGGAELAAASGPGAASGSAAVEPGPEVAPRSTGVHAADDARAPAHAGVEPPAWRRRWGIEDRVAILLIASGLVLIAAAPLFTSHDWASATSALLEELRPFPDY